MESAKEFFADTKRAPVQFLEGESVVPKNNKEARAFLDCRVRIVLNRRIRKGDEFISTVEGVVNQVWRDQIEIDGAFVELSTIQEMVVAD